ncbi:MAG TPA: hypothetical protein VFA79_10215 [Myxococcales bacterium]|nr:hypothetical protein [Myxococcales bacterium]
MTEDQQSTAPQSTPPSGRRRVQTPSAAREAEAARRVVEPTDYVVLQYLDVGGDGHGRYDHFSEVFPSVSPKAFPTIGSFGVWLQVHRVAARSQAEAIEAYTGVGEAAKQGTFRAVAFSSWKGTVVVKPPKQVVEDDREVVNEE